MDFLPLKGATVFELANGAHGTTSSPGQSQAARPFRPRRLTAKQDEDN